MSTASVLVELTASVSAFTEAIEHEFMPAISDFHFEIHRMQVEMLLAAPWYRHVRLRWRLRHGYKPIHPGTALGPCPCTDCRQLLFWNGQHWLDRDGRRHGCGGKG
jgi:hypothetical protein